MNLVLTGLIELDRAVCILLLAVRKLDCHALKAEYDPTALRFSQRAALLGDLLGPACYTACAILSGAATSACCRVNRGYRSGPSRPVMRFVSRQAL